MIFTMALYVLAFLIDILTVLLPEWNIWPETLLNGITYIANSFSLLNFLFPISDIFTAVLFLINFEVFYLTAKIGVKLLNYVRGTGSGLDI